MKTYYNCHGKGNKNQNIVPSGYPTQKLYCLCNGLLVYQTECTTPTYMYMCMCMI